MHATSTPPVRVAVGAFGVPAATGRRRVLVLVEPMRRQVAETTGFPDGQASVVGSTWTGRAFTGPGTMPTVAAEAGSDAAPSARSEASST